MEQFANLSQFGMAGFFILALIWAVVYFARRQDKVEHQNSERYQKVEDRMNKYMETDRDLLRDTVKSNTQVIKENSDVLHELKAICRNLKK